MEGITHGDHRYMITLAADARMSAGPFTPIHENEPSRFETLQQ
jgi:hypothetical protein